MLLNFWKVLKSQELQKHIKYSSLGGIYDLSEFLREELKQIFFFM